MDEFLLFIFNHFKISSDYIQLEINDINTILWENKRLSIKLIDGIFHFNYNIENGRNIYFSLIEKDIQAIKSLNLPINYEKIKKYFSNNIKSFHLSNFNLNEREKKLLLLKLNNLGFSKNVKIFNKDETLVIKDGNKKIFLQKFDEMILISSDKKVWSTIFKKDIDITFFDFKIKNLKYIKIKNQEANIINNNYINFIYNGLMDIDSSNALENHSIASYLISNKVLNIEQDLYININSINKEINLYWSNGIKSLLIKRQINSYIYSFKDYNLKNHNFPSVSIENLAISIIRKILRELNPSLNNSIINTIINVFRIDMTNCSIKLNNRFNIFEGIRISWILSKIIYELNIENYDSDESIRIIYTKNGIIYNEGKINISNISNINEELSNIKQNQTDYIDGNSLQRSQIIEELNNILGNLNISNLNIINGNEIYDILNIQPQFFYIYNFKENSCEFRWINEFNNDIYCKIERTNSNNIIRILFKGKYYRLTEGPNRLSFNNLYIENNNIKNIIDSIDGLRYWNLISDKEKRKLINNFINVFNINLSNINIIENNIYWKDDEFNYSINLIKASNNFLNIIYKFGNQSINHRNVYILDITNIDDINNIFSDKIPEPSNYKLYYNNQVKFSKKGLMPINFIPENIEE